jgi:osmoprotectant transport system ATP-binding protein
MIASSGVGASIELRGVAKRYGEMEALASTNLEFAAGATTVLIGPSGCGKSTLLRIVLGLVEPDAGEVRIEGERLGAHNIEQMRHRIGYVIQDGGLFPHLSARGNVELLARHLGWPQEKLDARVRALCELTQLDSTLLERYPAQLSGGQRQRVGLMRALALDPPVLLLDEPLGALDPMVRADLQRELKAIFARLKKTVVLVTHDMNEAAFLADRIVLMREGRIVQSGSLVDLLERPAQAFVSEFIGAQRSLVG